MTELYELSVQIWAEDGVWRWGICQEFESQGSDEFEILAYGQADTREAAVSAVAETLPGLFDEA